MAPLTKNLKRSKSATALDIGVYGARGIPSTYSGYETFLSVLLPEMVKRGHKVTIYCRRVHVPSDTPYLGVARVPLPAPRSKQFETLLHGFNAAIMARRSGHDVVFVVNAANAIYCLLGRATGQRIVLNTDGQEWLRGKWGRLAKLFFKGSAYLARFSATALISDSVAMQSIYKRKFRANSTVIPYCWTQIKNDEKGEILSGLGLKARNYFLIAGRLNPENNIHSVAEAYLQSKAEVPLVILGEANYDSPVQQRLSDLASSNPGLILAGHVQDRAAFACLLRESMVYIHAHSVGGINPSLIEAMGCGARILALDTLFNREALAETGSYFEDYVDELPQLLREIAAGNCREDTMGPQAAARASSHFDLDSVVGAHEELFRQAASQRGWRSAVCRTKWSS